MAETRQRIWTILRRASGGMTSHEIADLTHADIDTVQRYLSALKRAGYMTHEAEAVGEPSPWILERDTGPLAPKLNSRGEGRDYNTEPAMTAEELDQVIKSSGLSITQWAIQSGLGKGLATRIRQMAQGSRPVGRTIEEAAVQQMTTKAEVARNAYERDKDKDDVLFEFTETRKPNDW